MRNNKNNSNSADKGKFKGHKKSYGKSSEPKRGNRNDKPKPRLKIDLFGMHAVKAAWTNPKRHIHELYITNKALDAFDETLKRAHDMGLKRPSPTIIEKSALDNVTSQGTVHQGIGLNCQALDEIDIHDIIRMEDPKDHSLLIILDQVTDPHNVGAIIRSACAFGAAGMILQKKHAPDLNGILAKTACGGAEHLPVAYETNLTRSIEALQDAGYFAIGLAEEGDALSLKGAPVPSKLVLVLGAEGDGIRRLVRQQCDALISLPTLGEISSLNVSNAAAVALFAYSQQLLDKNV